MEYCFWREGISERSYAIEWYRREGVCGGDVGWEEEAVEDRRERFGFGLRNVCRDMIIFAIDSGTGFSYSAGGGG
jgi:hypothetical protein